MTLDEVKQKFAGKVGELSVRAVEKGSIKRYAEAVGNMNPLYIDEEYARNSRYGAIIAPPGFLGWPAKVGGPFIDKLMMDLVEAMYGAGFPNLLDAGIDLEFLVPVRDGDILVSLPRVTDLMVRESKEGRKMVFGAIETTYHNQNGQLVIKARQNLVCLPAA